MCYCAVEIGDVEMSLLFDVFCFWMQLVNETEDRYWENLLFWFVNLSNENIERRVAKKKIIKKKM